MEDTRGNLQNSRPELNKSTGRQDDGPHSCATSYISSGDDSKIKTLIEYNNDETLEIKAEMTLDEERHQSGDHNLLPDQNHLSVKCISSDDNSGARTLTEYDNAETLEIKQEIIPEREIHQSGDRNLLLDKNQLEENSFFSGNNSGCRTLIEYDNNETLEIKEEIIQGQFSDRGRHESGDHNLLLDKNHLEEISFFSGRISSFRTLIEYYNDETLEIKKGIIQDQEIHQSGDYNLISDKNHLDEKSVSCDNNFVCWTLIKPDNDETLDIKEEIVQDRENIDQIWNKKYGLKLCTVDIRAADIFAVKDYLRSPMQQKMQELKLDKKTNLKISQPMHNCAKCFERYTTRRALTLHERLEHAAGKPQFIGDVCGYKTNVKCNLSTHISSRHFRESKKIQARHKCNKCARSYSLLNNLYRHNRLEHAIIKPQFVCDVCGYKTKNKSHLAIHISQLHFKRSKALQAGHNCDKCCRSYSWLSDLKRHDRLKHAAVKPQFICDVCGYKANVKRNLSSHISVRHFKTSTTSQARHNCDKCSRNYGTISALNHHGRLKHAPVIPTFVCDICSYETNRKGSLLKHIPVCHSKKSRTSQARHTCNKCFRSYSWLGGLKQHDRLKHALVRP